MKFFKAGNLKIAYHLDGPENAPAITLSNSLMTDYSMWDSVIGDLSKSFRVLRYDNRGQGNSDVGPGPYTIAQLAEDVVDLLDFLDIPKTYFIGLSLGGLIGQYLAINFSSRLNALLLCNTASKLMSISCWDSCKVLALEGGMGALERDTLRHWFSPAFIRHHQIEVDRFHDMIMRTPVDGYIACVQAIRVANFTRDLHKIHLPTMIIAGALDLACTINQAQALKNGIVGSQLGILRSVGHLSSVESPQQFSDLVLSFLDRGPAIVQL